MHWRCLLPAMMWVLCVACDPAAHDTSREPASVSDRRAPTETPLSGGIYRLPLMNNPSTLDPAHIQDQYGVSIIRQIFEGLVRFGPHLMVLPALAETWQVSNGGQEYRFVLRSNARFQNGAAVTTTDVVFSLQRLIRATPPPAILPQLLKIKGAQAFRDGRNEELSGFERIDSHTFSIHLSEPYIPFLTALGMIQAAVVPKHTVLERGDGFGRRPVGSGPFKLISWEPDRFVRLKRHDGYYGPVALLDEIEYRIYAGGRTDAILADFRQGRLEEMPVFGDMRGELKELDGLHWRHRPSLSLFFYGINCTHPNLSDPMLRRTLLLALQRDRIVADVFGGLYQIADSILPPGMPGHDPRPLNKVGDPPGPADPTEAALTASTPKIVSLEIVSAIKSQRVLDELAIVRQNWSAQGIDLNFKFIEDWSQFENYLKSDAVQIFRYAWYADLPDPDSFISPLFASSAPFNFFKYKDVHTDRLLAEARSITDPLIRRSHYQRIQHHIMQSTPIIPLFYLSIDRVYQPTVRGIQLNPMAAELMPFDRVWLSAEPSAAQP